MTKRTALPLQMLVEQAVRKRKWIQSPWLRQTLSGSKQVL